MASLAATARALTSEVSKMPSSPSILIVGTGALACLFAARFAAAGSTVTMLGTWPEGMAALREKGVTLVDSRGKAQSYPVRVVADPQDCPNLELALVLVKAWQTERAARQLRVCLPSQGQVLSLQNGLGNLQLLAEFIAGERVHQGITTVGGTLVAPGRVRSGGEGTISLANIPQLVSFARLFEQAGFAVEKTNNIEALIWGKLAVNAAINPLTAILGVPNGALLIQPESRKLMAGAAAEVAAVAAALRIWLPFEDVGAAVAAVAQRTAGNHSSMLQDMQRGAPTEIEAINGAVVRVGRQAGVPTPVNETLSMLVKALVATKNQK